ncbi:MAG: glycoside hydrolase N-terminal domain-containing protein [Eubacterium sp.]|nr:glycoside hydrolase N-terminal domain-containing protein [Eubacterium sp.]
MAVKTMMKKVVKVLTAVIAVLLAAALLLAATLGIYRHSTQGDYTLLKGDGKKAFATTYTEVRTYPENKKQGRTWRDGMIGGNGKLGFINAGAPYHDTIIYQDVDYIMPSVRDRNYLPDLYEDLESARQAIVNLDDSYEAAGCGDWNYGYAFHPGQELRLTQEAQTFYKDYIRWTDFETGEVGVSYRDKGGTWTRKTFTSRTDDVTVTAIEQSDTGTKVNITLSLDDASGMYKYGWGDENKIQYKKLVAEDCSAITYVAHYPDYELSSLGRGGYAGVTYVVVVGGQKEKVLLDPDENWWGREDINVGEQNPAIKITDAEAVYLITKNDRTFDMGAFSDFAEAQQYDLVDTLYADCQAVAEKYGAFDYAAALAPSAASHKAMWDKVSFTLGDAADPNKLLSNEKLLSLQRNSTKVNEALLERLYQQARFAMICAAGYSMTRLSGMWTGEWMPGWRSEYTMDANVNLQSSGMNTTNLQTFGDGYIKFILRQLDDWQTNAKQCYNMDNAIKAPVNSDGDGALDAEYAHSYPFQYWNAGASWMLQPIYEYYQCFGNQTIIDDDGNELRLLEDVLLPALTLQANFWEQLVTPEYYTDADGNACYQQGKTALNEDEKYLIIPSYSPENTTGGDTYQSTLAANAAIDIAAAKYGLQMTVTVENLTKTDGYEARAAHWESLLEKLPDYQFAEDGAIKEWCANQYEDNNKHRHISHLYLAWPLYETQHDEQLAQAATVALNDREKENSASHGFVHQALVRARLKQGEEAYTLIHDLLDSKICYTSLMTDHNTNRGSDTYCTDTEFGLLGIVDEMLLYSDTGEIEFLPALPAQWQKGDINGLMARTQAEVSIHWENGTVTATVTAHQAQTIQISCAGSEPESVSFMEGETKTFDFDL